LRNTIARHVIGTPRAVRLNRLLLGLLVTTFLAPSAPLVVVLDVTLERRWGKKIADKEWFREAVRSRGSPVVISPGVQWLRVVLLIPAPSLPRPAPGP